MHAMTCVAQRTQHARTGIYFIIPTHPVVGPRLVVRRHGVAKVKAKIKNLLTLSYRFCKRFCLQFCSNWYARIAPRSSRVRTLAIFPSNFTVLHRLLDADPDALRNDPL